MQVRYDEAKFTEMLLYVAQRLRNDRAGGATKLNKVLFFAEFAHVRRHGQPIAGAAYQKLSQGPAPRRLRPLRQRLIDNGDAEIVVEDFLGYEMHRLVPLRQADLRQFSPDELVTIDRVLDDLGPLTGTQVSDLSHEEPGWLHVSYGETIPYELALVPKAQVATPTIVRLADVVADRYGIAIAK